MRPARKDKRYYLSVTEHELAVMHSLTYAMVEAYGLDTRIDRYKGARPIGLASRDLDCLEAVFDNAIRESKDTGSPEYQALTSIMDKINTLLDEAYPRRRSQ